MQNQKWSRETIYHKECEFFGDLMAEDIERYPLRFRPEFLAAYQSEDTWIDDPEPVIPPELYEAIGLGQEQCPVCSGSERYVHRRHGQKSGMELVYQLACARRLAKVDYRDVAKIANMVRA